MGKVTESYIPFPANPMECHLCGSGINVEKLRDKMLCTCECGFHAHGTIGGMLVWNLAKELYGGINEVIPKTWEDEHDIKKFHKVVKLIKEKGAGALDVTR